MPDFIPLSSILNDMDRYKDIQKQEEVYKVRALDAALRRFRRSVQTPWTLQKSTLRVFNGVTEYPAPADLDEIAFYDKENEVYNRQPDFRYTSIKEFYNDPNNRNDLAVIWDGGTKYLGIRNLDNDIASSILNNCEKASDWTASSVASTPTLDNVIFYEGNGSIKFTVTGSGTATMKGQLTDFTDSNYKRKYVFVAIYLDAVPTSLSLRLHIDASNYLEKTGITTQFSGQAMKADAWNIFAFDLGNATDNGTISTSSTFSYFEFDLVGASSGTYYVDSVYLREWALLNQWYYSKYYIATSGSTVADQEYFLDSSEVYSTDSQLIGESEFRDVLQYEAMEELLADLEKKYLKDEVALKRQDAWNNFYETHPSLKPQITTTYYNYENQ